MLPVTIWSPGSSSSNASTAHQDTAGAGICRPCCIGAPAQRVGLSVMASAAVVSVSLGNVIPRLGPNRPVPHDTPMSPAEVAEWEEFFRKGRQDKGG